MKETYSKTLFPKVDEVSDAFIRVTMLRRDSPYSTEQKYQNICTKFGRKFPELIEDKTVKFVDHKREIHLYLPMPIAHWVINTGLGLCAITSYNDDVYRDMLDMTVFLKLSFERSFAFTQRYFAMQNSADIKPKINPFNLQLSCSTLDVFEQSFAYSNTLIVGEIHDDTAARTFLIDHLSDLVKQHNVQYFYHETLQAIHQPYLDEYFDPCYDGDIPAKLLNFLSYTEQALIGTHHVKPNDWQGSHVELLRELKAAGIKRVIAIDSPAFFFSVIHDNPQEYFKRFLYLHQHAIRLYKENQSPDERAIFFVGGAHATTLELTQADPELPKICFGLSDLLTASSIFVSKKLLQYQGMPGLLDGALDCYIAYENKKICEFTTSKNALVI